MQHLEGKKDVEIRDELTRRDFLRVGALGAGAVGLGLADLAQGQAHNPGNKSCILLFLVGGPSHLDTWDLKPDAPEEVRGPFRPIATTVPGLQISEHFPRMASLARHYALVRSVHHDAAPVHETGHQLMQTGRLFRQGREYPHYGSAMAHLRPTSGDLPPSVVLPSPIGNTGVSVSHGQTAGCLGPALEPFLLRAEAGQLLGSSSLLAGLEENGRSVTARQLGQGLSPAARQAFDLGRERGKVREQYGWTSFGQSCLLARRLVEEGAGFVTVNMFETVFNEITWDCHADNGCLASTLEDYAQTLCPTFDQAYATLLHDLAERGLLESTLVVAMGEFGRTPKLNPRGGRDHWPGCWSVVLAGGGIQGGQVIGASDRIGSEPADRPVSPAEIAATIYQGLGIDPGTRIAGPEGKPIPLAEAAPIAELFS